MVLVAMISCLAPRLNGRRLQLLFRCSPGYRDLPLVFVFTDEKESLSTHNGSYSSGSYSQRETCQGSLRGCRCLGIVSGIQAAEVVPEL